MKSFFTRIQSKFSTSFGGRYVETILKEISTNENHIIKSLFPRIKENGYLGTEYHFKINDRERIADIVLLSKERGEPLAFAEIKYDDHKNDKNAGQLVDYIDFCKLNEIEFLYITQYYPPSSDLEIVKKHGYTHTLFSDIAELLLKQNKGELTKLFVDFLRDKGLVMEKISSDHIGKLLVRLFNPIKGQRIQGNIDMVQYIPENFAALMTNISVISQEMSQYLISNRKPTIDFFLEPTYQISRNRLNEILEDPGRGKVDFTPRLDDRNGGDLFVFARSSLVEKHEKDDWSYLEFGFCFSIAKGSKEHSSELYSTVYGKYISGEHYRSEKIGNSVISNKIECIRHLKSLLVSSIESAVKNDSSTKEIHTKALNSIKESIKR